MARTQIGEEKRLIPWIYQIVIKELAISKNLYGLENVVIF